MIMPELPCEGGCRCGQVRFRVSAAPLLTLACHCRGCQKMTAGAYSLSAAVPADGFEVIAGAPVAGGLHGPQAHHMFCPHCMSWMFTRIEGLDYFVNVRATLLDRASWFEPFVETCTSEGLPWARTPAPHSFQGMPAPEVFEQLVESYQAERSPVSSASLSELDSSAGPHHPPAP
jgi:hypothetical protein